MCTNKTCCSSIINNPFSRSIPRDLPPWPRSIKNSLSDYLKPSEFIFNFELFRFLFRNCFKFVVERSVLNDNLYMCIAVPHEIILYQWFEPRNSFVQLKSVTASVQRSAPFNLIFDMGEFKFRYFLQSVSLKLLKLLLLIISGAPNADYPQVCIGVYDQQRCGDEETKESEGTSKGRKELHLHYQLVDFNDHGKLEHFVAKSVNSDLYDTLRPLGENGFTYSDRNRRNVLAFKQLDRDTFFIAFENQVHFNSFWWQQQV